MRALVRPVMRPCARVLVPDIVTSQPSRPCGGLARPVPHALALVRLGLADLTYVGRDFADLLLVVALDDEPRWRLDAQRDPLRRGDRHRVAEAERELKVLALGLNPVADANDLQRL